MSEDRDLDKEKLDGHLTDPNGEPAVFRRCLIKDLPEDLLNKIADDIRPYSIALIGLRVVNNADKCWLVGSGTLIKVGSRKAILTAQHVVSSKGFQDAEQIGFAFNYVGAQRLIEKREHLEVIEIAKPEGNDMGPDLALIIPPSNVIGWLEAKGQFWDIGRAKKNTLRAFLTWTLVFGICAVTLTNLRGLLRQSGATTR
jgi:hypothetical protein